MEELLRCIQQAVADEYKRAEDSFGAVNHSDHESYAIIKEEVEEAQLEFNDMLRELESFWSLIKYTSSESARIGKLEGISFRAALAAAECIQVAAMAYKAIKTIEQFDRTASGE